MVRTPCCDQSGLRKGTWTPEEDRKLTAYVTRYGCWNWRQLPKYAGMEAQEKLLLELLLYCTIQRAYHPSNGSLSRCGKSYRLRWMNYLKPDLKHGNYSKEEDELITKLHESLGNRWSAIAAHLPGRTDNEIKNHWHTSLKRASKQESSESKRRSKNRKKRMEQDEIPPADFTAREILESSEFASQPSTSSPSSSSSLLSVSVSSSDLSSSLSPASASTGATDCTNVLRDFDDFMTEIAGESSGSFWTEPFLTDNYTIMNYPPSPFTSEFLLSSYDYFDDNVNPLIW